jgi:hypothetical protein
VEVETEEEGEQLARGKRRRWRWRWWGRKVGGRSEAGMTMVVEKEIGESERWRRGRGRGMVYLGFAFFLTILSTTP